MRNDSINEFKKAQREDLIKSNEEEINILKKYMPKQLTKEEINELIDNAIEETSANDIKDLGKVMRVLTPVLKNKCDMKEVTNLLKEKLNNFKN